MRGLSASSSGSSTRVTGNAHRANRVLARSHVLRTACLCLLALIPVHPALASNEATDQAGVLSESPPGWSGFEIGPTISLPLPAGSANRDEIGLIVGLSFTEKTNPNVGIGADVAYCYWPVSAAFKQKFNENLSAQTLNTLRLGGGTWGLQVVQLGAHIRVVRPATRGMRPWLQLGAGAYRVDPNTSGYIGDAGFFTVNVPPLKRTHHMGFSFAGGTDLFGGPRARMGLDANYHFVKSSDVFGSDLQVFTLGVHALLGW